MSNFKRRFLTTIIAAFMEEIKDLFGEKATAAAALEIKEMLSKQHGDKKIGDVITLAQVYQGMRGMTGLGNRD